MDETISNLNEVISIQANTSLPFRNLNIYQEINRIIQSIQMLIIAAETTIIYDFDQEEILNTNPAYFESILLNLITNALKYKSPVRPLTIELSLEHTGPYTLLTFKDNGLGINLNKYKDQLFGMYKTFHKNKDARGLGLYIVKTQVEAMKGKIEVESTIDIGTTFKLYFNQK
jgi:signal transduction histidine kinase